MNTTMHSYLCMFFSLARHKSIHAKVELFFLGKWVLLDILILVYMLSKVRNIFRGTHRLPKPYSHIRVDQPNECPIFPFWFLILSEIFVSIDDKVGIIFAVFLMNLN